MPEELVQRAFKGAIDRFGRKIVGPGHISDRQDHWMITNLSTERVIAMLLCSKFLCQLEGITRF